MQETLVELLREEETIHAAAENFEAYSLSLFFSRVHRTLGVFFFEAYFSLIKKNSVGPKALAFSAWPNGRP
jgi:hypothetical protein